MVLSGHVHNYQRIEQTIGGHAIPFIVAGHGGYHNLHTITAKTGDRAPDTGAVMKYGNKIWGFLTLTIAGGRIHGAGTEVDRNGHLKPGDTFDYPAAAIRLADPKKVPTL
jgi:hypothetical protein